MVDQTATDAETKQVDDPFDINAEDTPERSMSIASFAPEGETDAGEADASPEGEFPADMLTRATDAGFTEEQAKGFGSPEALEGILDVFDRSLAAQGRKADDTAVRGDAAGTKAGDAAGKTQPGEQLKVELDADVVEPSIAQAFTQVSEYVNSRLSDLAEAVDQLLDHAEKDIQSRDDERFDGFVGQLGDDFADLFGKGATSNLRDTSVHHRNRMEVRDQMRAMAAGYEHIGRTPPNQQELFQRALRGVFGDKIKSQARREISDKLKAGTRTPLNRPTGSKAGSGLSPEQRAIRSVGALMAEKGMGNIDVDAQEQLLPADAATG